MTALCRFLIRPRPETNNSPLPVSKPSSLLSASCLSQLSQKHKRTSASPLPVCTVRQQALRFPCTKKESIAELQLCSDRPTKLPLNCFSFRNCSPLLCPSSVVFCRRHEPSDPPSSNHTKTDIAHARIAPSQSKMADIAATNGHSNVDAAKASKVCVLPSAHLHFPSLLSTPG